MSRRRRNAFTLVELLVVITIIGMLMALLLPAVQMARESARRANCSSNMRNVSLALQQFEGTHKRFPGYRNPIKQVDGTYYVADLNATPPVDSYHWVVSILPQLEQTPLHKQWMALNDGTPPPLVKLDILLCPSHPELNVLDTPCSFVVNGGVPDIYKCDPVAYPRVHGEFIDNGIFFDHDPSELACGRLETNMDFANTHDGTSNTVAVSESLNAGEWAPVGRQGGNLAQVTEPYMTFLWHDATSASGPLPALPYWPINGPDVNPDPATFPDPTAYDLARPSSHHPGGVNVGFLDGKVRFLREDIDYLVYCLLLSTNGPRTRFQDPSSPLRSGYPPLYDANIFQPGMRAGTPDFWEVILDSKHYD